MEIVIWTQSPKSLFNSMTSLSAKDWKFSLNWILKTLLNPGQQSWYTERRLILCSIVYTLVLECNTDIPNVDIWSLAWIAIYICLYWYGLNCQKNKHLNYLQQIFDRFLHYGLKINKCHFSIFKLTFVKHERNENWIFKPDVMAFSTSPDSWQRNHNI